MPFHSSAAELLRAVVARYRALTVYADTGSVRTRGPRGEYETRSSSARRADGDFRFEFHNPHPYAKLRHRITRSVVGRAQGQAYFHVERPRSPARLTEEPDFNLAIAGATGVSHGAAHTIAKLLFDEIDGFAITDLRRPRFRGRRVIDGVDCHRITGRHLRQRVAVFIGIEDLLIRKIVWGREETVEHRADIDITQELPADRFAVPATPATPADMALPPMPDAA